jgi:hypothetical protein
VLGTAVGNTTHQASQILGFVAGAAVVAILGTHRTLDFEAAAFGMSGLIVLIWGESRRSAPGHEGTARPSLWSGSSSAAACC